jgi:hypothetical protein
MALADLLPDFAGETYLDSQKIAGPELTANGDRLAIGRLLADLKLDADDLEGAVATNSGFSFFALRAEGVPGKDLADAFVQALLEELPGTSLTDVDVEPLVLQRVVAEVDGEVGTLTVLPFEDAIVVAAAEPDKHDLVELTLWRLLHRGPERFLPAEIDGRPLQIVGMPGEAFPTSGDACSFLCPGELPGMAAAVGLEPTDVRLGYALLESPPAIAVMAFEFPGVASQKLADLREDLGAYRSWKRTRQTIGGKEVIRYQNLFRDEVAQEQWVYATDGVLYIVYDDPRAEDANPPLLEEAFAALP